MLPTFATQREPAGFRETPAVLQTNGGTAAGSVGVAVPPALVWVRSLLSAACLAAGGCEGTRQSAYFPETVTLTTAFGRDMRRGDWDRESVGANLTWRLKPVRVASIETNPNPSNPSQP